MLNKILFIVFITWYNASFAVFEKTNLVVNSLHDGIVNTIKDNGVLFSGDSFQLKIKPGDNTYLYAFLVDTSNSVTLLNSSNVFVNNNVISLPEDDRWYRLDDNIGTEILIVLGSKEKQSEADITSLIQSRKLDLLSNNGLDVNIVHIKHLDKIVVV